MSQTAKYMIGEKVKIAYSHDVVTVTSLTHGPESYEWKYEVRFPNGKNFWFAERHLDPAPVAQQPEPQSAAPEPQTRWYGKGWVESVSDQLPDTAPAPPQVRDLITSECEEIRDLLHAKNAAYGNSAIDPVRIFSKADPIEQLNVRIDDKLSRLMRGTAAGEDAELDLLGYLILKRVAQRLQKQ